MSDVSEQMLKDLLMILGKASAAPTMSLWLIPDEGHGHGCSRCNEMESEWIAAMPINNMDGDYGQTKMVALCAMCVGTLVVHAKETTTNEERPEPERSEQWPLN